MHKTSEKVKITLGNLREFREWNEKMFRRFCNERLYLHPNPIIRYIEDKRVKIILKLLHVTEKDFTLDVGCGEAYIMKRVKGNIIGLDLSSSALSLAKTRLRAVEKNNGYILMGDAQNLPFINGSFDKIICSEILEHVPLPQKLISEVSRVMKNEGIAILTIPNEENINRVKVLARKLRLFKMLFKNIPERMDNEWHLHIFNLTSVKKIIKSSNLKISKVVKIPSLIPIRLVLLCRKNFS